MLVVSLKKILCDHVRVYIFNHISVISISTKSFGIKIEHTQRAVVRLHWSIYLTVLHNFGWSMMIERL